MKSRRGICFRREDLHREGFYVELNDSHNGNAIIRIFREKLLWNVKGKCNVFLRLKLYLLNATIAFLYKIKWKSSEKIPFCWLVEKETEKAAEKLKSYITFQLDFHKSGYASFRKRFCKHFLVEKDWRIYANALVISIVPLPMYINRYQELVWHPDIKPYVLFLKNSRGISSR